MKLISWNVNGLRAVLRKEFAAQFAALNADVFCVQETKCQPGEADFAPEGSTAWNSAGKRDIPATCWCRTQPLSVRYGIGKEGAQPRGPGHHAGVSTVLFGERMCPTPREGLARIDYRMQWEDDLRACLLGAGRRKAGGAVGT